MRIGIFSAIPVLFAKDFLFVYDIKRRTADPKKWIREGEKMFAVIPSSNLYLERLENAPLDQEKSGALLLCVQIRISLKGMLWQRMQPYRRG